MALEPRFMFDAAGAAAGAEALAEQAMIDAAEAVLDQGREGETAAHDGRSLVVVDAAVDGFAELVEAADPSAELLVLESEDDGLARLAAHMAAAGHAYESVHVVSHGRAGELALGNTDVTLQTLASQSDQWQTIGRSLQDGGDLLLYGCRVAADGGQTGLIGVLAEITGRDVAASTDHTGAAGLGGDWELEASTGAIAAALPVSGEALAGFDGLLDVDEVSFGAQVTLTATLDGAFEVAAGDFDGDGDLDALAAAFDGNKIVWFENTDGLGAFAVDARAVSGDTAIPTAGAEAADLDGDGDSDVLAHSWGGGWVGWYENLDGQGTFADVVLITTLTKKATAARAIDLDGDGDLDVLSSSRNNDRIAWYENDGSGGFGSQKVISNGADGAYDVWAADLNGDGRLDVLSASYWDDRIAWYEQRGDGQFGQQQTITMLADGAVAVRADDLDGDGDMDVLSASVLDNTVAWYENDGAGRFGAPQTFSGGTDRANLVTTVDMDGDGDADVVTVSRSDTDLDQGNRVVWYENIDGAGTFGPQITVSTNVVETWAVIAADIDADGDPDLLSASRYDDRVAWYRNERIIASSGPFEVAENSTAGTIAGDIDARADGTGLADQGFTYAITAGNSVTPVNDAPTSSDGPSAPAFTNASQLLFNESTRTPRVGQVSTTAGGTDTGGFVVGTLETSVFQAFQGGDFRVPGDGTLVSNAVRGVATGFGDVLGGISGFGGFGGTGFAAGAFDGTDFLGNDPGRGIRNGAGLGSGTGTNAGAGGAPGSDTGGLTDGPTQDGDGTDQGTKEEDRGDANQSLEQGEAAVAAVSQIEGVDDLSGESRNGNDGETSPNDGQANPPGDQADAGSFVGLSPETLAALEQVLGRFGVFQAGLLADRLPGGDGLLPAEPFTDQLAYAANGFRADVVRLAAALAEVA